MAAARVGSAASAIFILASKARAISGVIFTGAGAINICTSSAATASQVLPWPLSASPSSWHRPVYGMGGVGWKKGVERGLQSTFMHMKGIMHRDGAYHD